MKKYNSIDGRIHTNSRLWYFIPMAVRRTRNAEKTLEKAYNVKIETGYMSSKGTVYILHEENLMLLFETIKELQQYLEEVY